MTGDAIQQTIALKGVALYDDNSPGRIGFYVGAFLFQSCAVRAGEERISSIAI
jgi:hypothetical protein